VCAKVIRCNLFPNYFGLLYTFETDWSRWRVTRLIKALSVIIFRIHNLKTQREVSLVVTVRRLSVSLMRRSSISSSSSSSSNSVCGQYISIAAANWQCNVKSAGAGSELVQRADYELKDLLERYETTRQRRYRRGRLGGRSPCGDNNFLGLSDKMSSAQHCCKCNQVSLPLTRLWFRTEVSETDRLCTLLFAGVAWMIGIMCGSIIYGRTERLWLYLCTWNLLLGHKALSKGVFSNRYRI